MSNPRNPLVPHRRPSVHPWLFPPFLWLMTAMWMLSLPSEAHAALGSTLYTGWDGEGSISVSPPGNTYSRRTTVTLTAVPASGWTFDHWGGDISSTDNPVKVKMLTNRDVTAFFRCTSCGGSTGPFVAGKTYMGRNQYIEYIAGDLPIIVSAPHGGYLTPDEIPDRTYGTTTADGWTEELIRQVRTALHAYFGGYPHIVICHLDRIKLDANRELEEAAQGNPYAIQAWYEYHDFLDAAATQVSNAYGAGLYIDLHGQSDDPDRLELGYLLLATELMLSDTALNDPAYADLSSIRSLAYTVDLPFSELLRGETSLGGMFETLAYPSVPSPTSPDPGRTPYYSGGYNTEVHGSRDGGTIDGIQIESNMTVRESELARSQFAEAFALVMEDYLQTHYGLSLP